MPPILSQLRTALGSRVRGTPVEGAARWARNSFEGAGSLARAPGLRKTRQGAGILMYHGVTPEIRDPLVEVAHIPAKLFRAQVRHLKRHFRVVPLAEVVRRVECAEDVPDDWAVLTFDDGYRNNLSCAREILAEEGDLPMSLFVPTELIGTRTTLLTTLVVMAFARGRVKKVRVPRPDGEWEWRSLHDRNARDNAYWEMLPVIKALAAPEQQAVAGEFFSQFGDGELAEIRASFPSFDWLDWDEVRELAASGVDIGGHTRTHVSLSERLPVARVQDEVKGCRERILRETGTAPAHFAYPNGQATDICDAAVQAVEDAGFRCALTTSRGTARSTTSRFEIPRLSGCIDTMARFRLANASGYR